jgi:glycosyltransferase involved in cell wall biosynthesis
MVKFAAIENDKIKVVSDYKISSDNIKIVQLPEELWDVSPDVLITKYKYKNNKFVSKSDKLQIENLKIAFVSNWKMKCGIATYAENLWSEVIDYINDYKFFIEKRDNYLSPLDTVGSKKIDPQNVIPCWERGKSLQNLVLEIKKYNPDVIWIQHEFGLWSNAAFWLSMLTQLSDYRVIITMHSVFHHRDKTICEAAMPEIVVHSQGAYEVLKNEKKVSGKVNIIPHGCFPPDNQEKLWNFYKSDHTFMQFGFGFRYKGWENAIKTVAILKNKFPSVFFTGLFSESDFSFSEHQIYYDELMSLVKSLKIEENVAIIRGFQSEETLDSYLRTNKATLFPYISHPVHEVYGSSGAAREAMSKGVPVITSSVNHFTDLPTIKADTPEQMAAALEKLFSNSKASKEQIEIQNRYLKENTWEKVALKYINLIENP